MLTSFVYKCHVRQYFHTFLKSFHFFNSFDFYFHQFLQTVKKISSFLLLIVLFFSLLGLLRYPIGPITGVDQRLLTIRRLSNHIHLNKLKEIADSIWVSKLRYGLQLYSEVRTSNEQPTSQIMKELQKAQNKLLRAFTTKKKFLN